MVAVGAQTESSAQILAVRRGETPGIAGDCAICSLDGTTDIALGCATYVGDSPAVPAPRRTAARFLSLLHGTDLASWDSRARHGWAHPPRDPLHRRKGRVLEGGDLHPAAPALAVRQRVGSFRDRTTHVSFGAHVYGAQAGKAQLLDGDFALPSGHRSAVNRITTDSVQSPGSRIRTVTGIFGRTKAASSPLTDETLKHLARGAGG